MAANNYYLGNVSDLASNMNSMFGRGGGIRPLPPIGIGPDPIGPGQGTGTPSVSGGAFDPLAAQAIRPASFGSFDPAYGQNLATFIGNTFQRPQQNTALQFNPYGNLTDANVQYPNLGGGNAPLPGLPQTLLQWAQWFNPTALGTNTPPPVVGNSSDRTGRSGGGRNRD